jgi:hypothetical protein
MKIHSASRTIKTPLTLLAVLAVSSGLSCAVSPGPGAGPSTEPAATATLSVNDAVNAAYTQYTKRDFTSAATGYDALIGSADDNTRQLAYLGKALIHLSTDPQWRDLDEAGRLLQSAETLGSANGSVEASMLMNALSSLAGVEANISELNSKVSNSASEIARLKQERDSLQAEQTALNEALEKLKALTIGN